MTKQKMEKRVFVITGASGTGKTTVANYLSRVFKMHKVVTHTTRQPRPGEVDGVDYYFETISSIKRRHLLECVNYDGCIYGSSKEGLEAGWNQGHDDVIVLETTGAATYHHLLGDRCVVIYLTVSSAVSLSKRQQERGESTALVQSRLNSLEDQRDRTLPASLASFAHVVVNDNWGKTKIAINRLVQADK